MNLFKPVLCIKEYWLHKRDFTFLTSTLKKEVICFFQNLSSTHRIERCRNPEDHTMKLYKYFRMTDYFLLYLTTLLHIVSLELKLFKFGSTSFGYAV
jgi:hypothetical protein